MSSPRALTRFIDMIDIMANTSNGVTLAQLSVSVGSPKSSLLSILRSLSAAGYFTRDQDKYRLGPAMFRLASKVLSVRSLPPLIKQIMHKTAEECGESVYFAVLDEANLCVRYADGVESHQVVRYAAPIGAERPLHCGAGALAMLAYKPEQWRRNYLKQYKLEKVTPATITDRRALERRLEEIRTAGVATSIAEAAPSAAGVAAPVFDSSQNILGALVIAAPMDRFLAHREPLEALVRRAAAEASGL